VWGYLKDPPKAGSRWGKWTKNRLNRFLNRLNRFPLRGSQFIELLSRRLDRTQNRLSRAQIRLNRFSKKSMHMNFLTTFDCQTGRIDVAEEIVQKPVEPVSGLVEPVFETEEQVLIKLK
jgi:hypothetical protein